MNIIRIKRSLKNFIATTLCASLTLPALVESKWYHNSCVITIDSVNSLYTQNEPLYKTISHQTIILQPPSPVSTSLPWHHNGGSTTCKHCGLFYYASCRHPPYIIRHHMIHYTSLNGFNTVPSSRLTASQ